MKKFLNLDNLLFSVWALSFLSVAGSFFFSFIMGFAACTLCLIQRGLMIILTVTLPSGIYKKNYQYAWLSLIIGMLGLGVALYQYGLQKIPNTSTDLFCNNIDCTYEYINWLGFITIPLLSAIAFLFIVVLSIILIKKKG